MLILIDFFPPICEAAGIPLPDNLDIDGRSFMSLLRGGDTPHREWIYNWFSRNGEAAKARIFAVNQRYKLYDSGEFYEVPKDYAEQYPLNPEALDAKAREMHQMLSEVLERYSRQRLNKVPQ